jgi:hypothetical protein
LASSDDLRRRAGEETAVTSDIEARTIRRISWRLIPFLIVCYLLSMMRAIQRRAPNFSSARFEGTSKMK